MEALLHRARSAWAGMSGLASRFTPGQVTLGVSPGSMFCPAGWAGIVVLGDAALISAPDQATASVLRRALADVPLASLADPLVVTERADVDEVLGPAELAFTDRPRFRPRLADVGELPAGDPAVGTLLASVSPAEAKESALAAVTSAAYVVHRDGQVVAASGYQSWPGRLAHLCVLTHPAHRGRGLAGLVASAAVADALSRDLLPQWRARVPASIRVAAGLGFAALGSQLSVHVRGDRLP